MINERHAKQYCCEDISKIENYDKAVKDTTQIWHLHHKVEIMPYGVYSRQDLIDNGLYWHVPAAQLIFLTRSEHRRLHNMNRSEEHKRKISKSMSAVKKGKPTWNKGKHLSEELRAKISDARKGVPLSEEHKQRLSAAVHELKWFNNGVKCVRARECPQGFILGRLSKKK